MISMQLGAGPADELRAGVVIHRLEYERHHIVWREVDRVLVLDGKAFDFVTSIVCFFSIPDNG